MPREPAACTAWVCGGNVGGWGQESVSSRTVLRGLWHASRVLMRPRHCRPDRGPQDTLLCFGSSSPPRFRLPHFPNQPGARSLRLRLCFQRNPKKDTKRTKAFANRYQQKLRRDHVGVDGGDQPRSGHGSAQVCLRGVPHGDSGRGALRKAPGRAVTLLSLEEPRGVGGLRCGSGACWRGVVVSVAGPPCFPPRAHCVNVEKCEVGYVVNFFSGQRRGVSIGKCWACEDCEP